LYVSAIAFQLSKVNSIPALEIASALAQLIGDISTRCCQFEPRLGAADEQGFTVQVVPPGWIHFELTEPKLASWLQHLTQAPLLLGRYQGEEQVEQGKQGKQGEQGKKFPASPRHRVTASPSSSSPHSPRRAKPYAPRPSPLRSPIPKGDPEPPHLSPLFTVQYAHTRCCSLLQMANREGLITLKQTNWDTSSAFWLAVSPNPIPWLNSEQKLCLYHPAERALMAQLLALLDELYCPRSSHQPINLHKVALDLSQTFQTFYSSCQIWGEVKNQNISLSQARLGLVLITQSALRLLLQDRLGVAALQEL